MITKWDSSRMTTTGSTTYYHGIYNHGHNILRTFDVLPNFSLTTSETKSDY